MPLPSPKTTGSRSPVMLLRTGTRLLIAALLILLLVNTPVFAGRACPGEGCVYVRPVDQIYVVNTRPVGCSTNLDRLAAGVRVKQYAAFGAENVKRTHRRWQDASLEELTAAVDPTTPTILYAHGNRVENYEVLQRGLWVYDQLMRCRQDDRPVQFIIFSWNSSEIKGMLNDVREKAVRTRPVGKQMAWLIDQLPSDAPLGLLGYSFGARVMSGATHLLAGGSLSGLTYECQTAQPRQMNAVFMAAALNADWLGPGHYHGCALQTIDRLLVSTNRLDPAMRFYGFISRKKHLKSLGLTGPTCLSHEYASRTRLYNVTPAVGNSHSMCRYMVCRPMMANVWRYLTFADAERHSIASNTPEVGSQTAKR